MAPKPSAVSAVALNAATPPRLVGGAIGEAGSKDALAQLSRAMAELKALAIQPLLQRSIDALQANDHVTGGEWAIKALEKDETNGVGWYLLGIARERAGDFGSSVTAYEQALKLLPDHGEVANDLGRLAYRMGMVVQAEKLFRHFLVRHPDHHEGANNLACALRDQQRFDEAVEVLRPAILKSPEAAMLWNTMGTVVAEQGDYPNAEIFFREALRLDPKLGKALYNFGNARLMQGYAQEALEACEAALKGAMPEEERQMMRLARSTILIALGRLGEGWDDYEARLHPQFADVTHFVVDRPRWQPGTDLSGKSLLVVGEQGLGDEILFANVLADLRASLGEGGRTTVAVEPRLVALFARSFPEAQVVPHATYSAEGRTFRGLADLKTPDDIDLWSPMGSLLRSFRRDLTAFPDTAQGYLRPDAGRVAHWRKVLEDAPAGPKVGLLWKSGVTAGARQRHFSPFQQWAPVLSQPGVCFVNLQYGDCAAEIALARKDFGAVIWEPPGIDLKQDLDDVAALACALDLVVGFSNATFNIAAACGAPVWLITTPAAWPRLGTEDRYPWYPQTRVFAPDAYNAWAEVMEDVAAALGRWAER